ncbi:MAG: 3'-5' exonuclease [Bacteroidetes bacterium GWE2_41_25]|nr:MAG: 3'-5' exonuclease [Bacteroidetes bacterium GWA2_40_15]OFX98310.1 MAG: 3'-5' exonuclease [Bacteroidetes bacterium GWC2_40_22]OFY05042.1 MAG: 3'-5' exonuclease [Bacteroidetes bacterium GWE2_41_25]OFY57809.1 MAG: 3'-5' exonuclease [Bacteroidetes bacterium GWF2_41_9]HAM09819.1 3'-5' exonuclease [Bacteroidales bacterium]
MLDNIQIEDILFLDIETVPNAMSFEQMDLSMQKLWDRKSKQFRSPEQTGQDVYERAGIYSEFGKIICISVGFIKEKDPYALRLKSFYGDDEKTVLSDFSQMLSRFSKANRESLLCAHNGKEFDFPYIARRMVINGLLIPDLLDNAGKKPWEVKLLDTMDLWKFGDYKNYTSLDLLTSVLGIPTPKDDIDGSMVAGIYYIEKDIERIVRYCEKDVVAIAQVLLRFMNKPMIGDEKIESVTFT